MHRDSRTVATFYVFVYLFIWGDFRHTAPIEHLIYVMDLRITEIVTEHCFVLPLRDPMKPYDIKNFDIANEFKCNINAKKDQ